MTWSIYKKSSVMIKFLAYLLDDNAELQKIDIFEKWKKSMWNYLHWSHYTTKLCIIVAGKSDIFF